MYWLSADPSLAVLNVLRTAGSRPRWSGATDRELLDAAVRSLLDAELLDVAAVVDEDHPSDRVAMRIARRRLAEMRLFLWAQDLNLNRGAAPSTVALLRRAREEGDTLPAAVHSMTATGRPATHARKWAQQWRARWQVKIGVIRARENAPASEMRRKVRVLFIVPALDQSPPLLVPQHFANLDMIFWFRFSVTFLRPESGNANLAFA